MDLKQIEKLMAAMKHAQIKRLVIKRQDFEIELETESFSVPAAGYVPPTYTPPAVSESKPSPVPPPIEAVKEQPAGLYVTSPMVGTFYAASSPDDPPFVKPGDSVDESTVVCIIEAMKVMNEVKAGVKGIISEVLLKNGEPVEFGSHIFRVTPA